MVKQKAIPFFGCYVTVGTSRTFYDKVPVAEAQALEAGGKYQWDVEIALPGDGTPSLENDEERHEWRMFAGLDRAGNDPDSGWVTVEVAAPE